MADVDRHEPGPLSREMGVRHLRRLHGPLHQPRSVYLDGASACHYIRSATVSSHFQYKETLFGTKNLYL